MTRVGDQIDPESMDARLSGRPQTTAPPTEPKPGEISVSADLTAWWGPWGVTLIPAGRNIQTPVRIITLGDSAALVTSLNFFDSFATGQAKGFADGSSNLRIPRTGLLENDARAPGSWVAKFRSGADKKP